MLHARGIGGAVEVPHQDQRRPSTSSLEEPGQAPQLTGAASRVRRAGVERAPGRLQLGAEKHAPIPVIARAQAYYVPCDDRKATQDGGALVESHHPAREASHPAIARGGADVVKAQRGGEPAGNVAPSPSRGRLLQADQVDVEAAKGLDRHGQPLLEVLAVTSQAEAAMEHVVGDDAKRPWRVRTPHRPRGGEQEAATSDDSSPPHRTRPPPQCTRAPGHARHARIDDHRARSWIIRQRRSIVSRDGEWQADRRARPARPTHTPGVSVS